MWLATLAPVHLQLYCNSVHLSKRKNPFMRLVDLLVIISDHLTVASFKLPQIILVINKWIINLYKFPTLSYPSTNH